MATKKKLLQAAAGSAGGAGGLNVEDVFSTYLRSGTGAGTSFSVSNDIDLAGEGGLVWYKRRTGTAIDHILVDSERGAGYVIESNTTDYSRNRGWFTSFNSDGFSGNGQGNTNDSGEDFASWTFRKAPKFFTCLTYTGNGSLGGALGTREISHSLDQIPGCIIVKATSNSDSWYIYHRKDGTGSGLFFTTDAENSIVLANFGTDNNSGSGTHVPPTSTVFTIGENGLLNKSGVTYVAYLFAHNDGDASFGPDADADIIKCGSYTGNGSSTGPVIDLGFEPQWLLIKNATTGNTAWSMWDNMRGVVTGGNDAYLQPSASSAEASYNGFAFTPTGFKVENTAGFINNSGDTYIYIAIRRGPMGIPESATDVFAIDTVGSTGDGKTPHLRASFPVDMSIRKRLSGGETAYNVARLISGKALSPDSTAAELSIANFDFDYMNGWGNYTNTNSDYYGWMWRRAPNFFDVSTTPVLTSSTGSITHNLGVAPEMAWVKARNTAERFYVYHKDVGTGSGNFLALNENSAVGTYGFNIFTGVSDTSISYVNLSNGANYIAYLFASLDGVSKVFSVTKSSGSDASVNCGFSAGPRFVLLKRTDSTGDWYVWDSERGIVSGNDPYLLLNSTAAEVTSTDYIDPTSNGFTIVNGGLADGDYIGYAVA